MSRLTEVISNNRKAVFWWVIMLLVIYFPLFMDLGDLAMRTFDEPRMAVNAYEITRDHSWLVTHYNGQIEMWNTKPPLMMWCQAILIKILGTSELTIRLPAAISAAITCIMLLAFSQKFMKSFFAGFAAVLVLITAHGYVGIHSARTGDYDPIVTMFTTFYCLSFFIFTETGKNKWLLFTFIGLTFAVMTKGVVGVLFLPALFMYAVIKKRLWSTLRNKWFYSGLVLFLITVLGYYYLREHYNPGYMHAVWENELGGRYLSTIEEHQAIFWFYINNLIDSRFSYWIVLLIPAIALGLTSKEPRVKNITQFLTLAIVIFLLIISTAKTKLYWYDVPLYPLFALIIGNMIKAMYDLVKSLKAANPSKYYVVKYLGILPLFIYPYSSIVRSSYKPVEENEGEWHTYRIEYYMQQAERGQRNLDNYSLYYTLYEAPQLFYIDILNDKNQHVKLVRKADFKPGDNVFVSQKELDDSIKIKYDCQFLDSNHNVKSYHIIGPKVSGPTVH